jgi:beta-phosphoglucomutase
VSFDFKGVLFDMDGVVIDNNAFHRAAWKQVALELWGLVLSEHDLDSKVDGRRNPEIFEQLRGYAPTALEAQHLHDRKEQIYRELAAGKLSALEGLERYLNWLEGRNIPFALVTSADTVNVEFGFGQIGLGDVDFGERFARRILGHDVQNGKPHPEPYQKGAALLNLEPAVCLVHEDALAGVHSGVAAGCTVCAVSTSQSDVALLEAGATFVVRDFEQWLEGLEG